MIFAILSHQWKSFWRGRNVGKSVAMQLFVGFILLYLLFSFLLLGIFLHGILVKAFPGQDVIRVFCGFLLYYFLFDLVLRYLAQELPVLSAQPYLIQNIRRRQLVTFLNLRSLFHFANLLPLIFLIPFVVGAVGPVYGPGAAWTLGICILLLAGFNHFILLYIKRKSVINTWWLLGFIMAISTLILLDFFKWVPLRRLSAEMFMAVLQRPAWIVAPAILLLLAFIINRHFLLRHLYVEEIATGKKVRRSADYSWLRSLGLKGELMALDLKLIFRNKRPKYSFVISIIIPLYGLVVFRPETAHSGLAGVPFVGALLVTGAFIVNYGQWLFAWQSVHFDGLLSSNIDLASYIRSKLLLFTIICTFTFVASTAYGLIDRRFLVIIFVAWLYNIGFNSVLAVWLSTYKYKGVDLAAGSMSFQGTSLGTFLNIGLQYLAPILLVVGFDALHLTWTGFGIIGGIGLISLLLRNWWIQFLVREFNKRKYLILQGFRES